MSSPVGRSRGQRPVVSTPPAATRRAAPPPTSQQASTAARTPAQQRNQDRFDTMTSAERRQAIGRQAAAHPHLYSTMVGGTNRLMQMGNVDLSAPSARGISQSLEQVHNGTIPQSTAHFRESRSFARDAVQSYMRGDVYQAEFERAGAMLNLAGGAGMWTLEQGEAAGRAVANGITSTLNRIRQGQGEP